MAPSVKEYYAGKNILITGATGFLGKVLVEKLLRSCSDVDTIYLLLREKKGLTSEERLKQLCNNPLFLPLKEKKPDIFKKLKVVAGDILEDELGLSNDDREELKQRCNMVFHSAACVRFDQKLKDAVALNTTGTLRVLQLAESMQNLEVLVHLSTAFNRCELEVLEEKLYPAVHKPSTIIDICKWMDNKLLEHLEPKLIGSEPNTYAYTKAITEEMVAEYGHKFPIAIARPSIVSAVWKEPIIGWVDNLNGPTGILVGAAKGVIRTMHCDPSYQIDVIPVDAVVNGCILLAYATGIDKSKEARFYNITLSGAVKYSWGHMIELAKKWINVYPHVMALWYPGGSAKAYWIIHQICFILTHLLPAYFVDAMMFLLGKKTFLVKAQKRISDGLSVLQYYTTKEWHFQNTNFMSLRNRISEREDKEFYTDVSESDIDDYMKHFVLGSRVFCCKEELSNLPQARKLHRIRYAVDRLTKVFLVALFMWMLYSYSYVFTNCLEFLDKSLMSISPISQVKAENEAISQFL